MSDHDHAHHVTPAWILNAVFGALLVLTFATVAAIKVDLGWLNVYLAVGIAAIKAVLVVFFFMHLKWDRGFHTLCCIGSFLFVAIFMGYVLVDSGQYRKDIQAYDAVEAGASEAE